MVKQGDKVFFRLAIGDEWKNSGERYVPAKVLFSHMSGTILDLEVNFDSVPKENVLAVIEEGSVLDEEKDLEAYVLKKP